MSNSPFDLFRRNLKPMMVFLTGLAMFAFVVLPMLDTYMRQTSGGVGADSVARFGKTELSRSRIEFFTRNHQSTLRFLTELAQETISRGGTPKVAGFQYDTQSNQVRSVGINPQPSMEGSIRTLMYASQAQGDGFDLDDNSLQVWVEQFTDGLISNREIDSRLMESTQNQMGRPHLYEQLRNHLLASLYQNRGYSTLFLGGTPMTGPLMTPDENWRNFLKLNRNAVVTSYGVLVNDYIDKTNPKPSEAEIVATYEAGKERDFDEQSPEPAFHRRYSAKFEYVAADFQTFLDQEVAKLTEEQLRAEYQRRLQGGEFKLPATTAQDAMDSVDETAAPTAEAEQTEEPKTEEPKTEEPKAEEPKTEETPAEAPAPPAEPEAADSTAQAPADAPPATDDGASGEEVPQSSDQSQAIRSQAVRLVAIQQDGEPQAADSPNAPAEATEPPAATVEPPPADAPQPRAEEVKPADAPKEEAPKEEAPKEEAPKEEAPKEETPKADAPKEEAPQVETFENVRERIAREMAGPVASQRMSKLLAEINDLMGTYFNQLAIYESSVSIGQAGEAPVRPDLKQLAAQNGLQYELIGPYNEATISDEPIANSSEMGGQFGSRGPSFSVMMFGFDNGQTQLAPQPLYSPIQTADGPAGKAYLSWKIEEKPAYTPSLSEVRDEVITVIRMQEALKLARAAAEAIAKQASKSPDEPLKSFVPEDKQENLKEGLGPFTWMNSFGFAGATIGNVPELDSVGDEFMKAAFTTEIGQYGVAVNQPGRVVYVIEPTKFEPAEEVLREQFKQPRNRMMAMLLGNDAAPIVNDFYESIDKQAGFELFLDEEQ